MLRMRSPTIPAKTFLKCADEEGWTALHFAVTLGMRKLVSALLMPVPNQIVLITLNGRRFLLPCSGRISVVVGSF